MTAIVKWKNETGIPALGFISVNSKLIIYPLLFKKCNAYIKTL